MVEIGNSEQGVTPTTIQTELPSSDDLFAQILGTQDNSMFGTPIEKNQESDVAPGAPATLSPEQTKAREVEENSSRYWQSQYDKLQNEVKELRNTPVQQQLPPRNPNTGQFMPQQQAQAAFQQQVQTGEMQPPQPQKFPDPPARPKAPAGFSRAEAMSDDRSESAIYLNSLDNYNADMAQYTNDRIEFGEMQRIQETEKAKIELEQRRQETYTRQVQEQEIGRLATHLRDGYQFNNEQIQDFFQTMSDPNSISIDNLAKLYSMSKGIPLQANPQQIQRQVTQPSGEFQQQQRAQQVPNPMGVYPSVGTNADSRSPQDLVFDTILSQNRKSDPFAT